MNDPVLVRRFERLGDLLGEWQRLIERDRPPRDPIGESRPSTSSKASARTAPNVFKTVDAADAGMVQRGENLRLTLKPCEPV